MPNMMVPSPEFRSPVAAPGLSGFRDDLVYSAVCVGNGATGQVIAFAQGQGGPIQSIGTAPTLKHQTTFSLATTNLSQSGVIGSNIGDIGVREIGINVEQAYYTVAAGAVAKSSYGASAREMAEILNKMSYQLNLVNKPMQQGPLWAFPSPGGMAAGYGVSQYDQAAASLSLVNSAQVTGRARRLELVLALDRASTIQAVFSVAGGDTLSFSDTGAAGDPTLIWNVFYCNVAADLAG